MEKRPGTIQANKHCKVGSIISSVHATKRIFAIVGQSYDELVMLRIYEQHEIDDLLRKLCYEMAHTLKNKAQEKLSLPLYADTSRVITNSNACISKLLDDKTGNYLGPIHFSDMKHLLRFINSADTIAQDIKSKYFSPFF